MLIWGQSNRLQPRLARNEFAVEQRGGGLISTTLEAKAAVSTEVCTSKVSTSRVLIRLRPTTIPLAPSWPGRGKKSYLRDPSSTGSGQAPGLRPSAHSLFLQPAKG